MGTRGEEHKTAGISCKSQFIWQKFVVSILWCGSNSDSTFPHSK